MAKRSIQITACLLITLLGGCYAPTELTLNATQKAEWVEFSGKTTLPDGAQLLVGIYRPEMGDPIAQALPIIKKGHYQGKLKSGRLPKGRYRLVAEFSPRAFTWSSQVLPKVGKNGENLHGPLVVKSEYGYRVLQRQEWVQIN